MQFVKIISTSIKSAIRIVKFLRYGKSDVQEVQQALPYGLDSNPVKDMIALHAETGQVGKSAVIGYLNLNAVAEVGGTRMYSTDEDGAVQFAIYLRADGTAEVGGDTDFMVRYSELESAFNELKSDFNDFVTKHNQLLTEYKVHVHPGVTSGSSSTGATVSTQTPASSTTADISGAKIEEIKTI